MQRTENRKSILAHFLSPMSEIVVLLHATGFRGCQVCVDSICT